jgi:hypothetical protein
VLRCDRHGYPGHTLVGNRMEQRRLAAAVHTYQPLLATFPGACGMHRARRLCSMPCPEQQVPGARRRAMRAKQADEAVSHVTKQCHPARGTPAPMYARGRANRHARTDETVSPAGQQLERRLLKQRVAASEDIELVHVDVVALCIRRRMTTCQCRH